MKIQLWSDLHLNWPVGINTLIVMALEADVLVIAGDMTTGPLAARAALGRLRQETSIPIIYVLGNHEFYGWSLDIVREYRQAVAQVPDVHLLERDALALNGVRFLGATLWTDLDNGECAQSAALWMNDFNYIRTETGLLTSRRYMQEHELATRWLVSELEKPTDYSMTVIVTHHAPTWNAVPPKFGFDEVNGAFFSHLDDVIMRYAPHYWLFGHTHCSVNMCLGNTRLIANPYGYPHELDTGFRQSLVIDTEDMWPERK